MTRAQNPSIYNIQAKLERTVKRIEKSDKISPRNKELILKFYEDFASEGHSLSREEFYLQWLYVIAQGLSKDFPDATEADLRQFVNKIEKSDYSAWTKQSIKVTIKKFYKWLEGKGEEYPQKIRWIKTGLKTNSKKLPEDILTEDEIKKMIEACDTLRDRALVAVLYESGCRIGEFASMRIKSIQFDRFGAVISVHGKTGSRRVRLVSSVPYLAAWLSNHPNKDDQEAHVWICIGTLNHGKLLRYQTFRKVLLEIAAKAGIKKEIRPHAFRHARATHLANKLTEAQMKEFFGWTQSSEMAATYVHLSGRDVDDAILQLNGIKPKEEARQASPLAPKVCPRCEHSNPTTAKICNRCGLALDLKEALEQERKLDELARLVNSPDILEKLIERKVAEILGRRA